MGVHEAGGTLSKSLKDLMRRWGDAKSAVERLQTAKTSKRPICSRWSEFAQRHQRHGPHEPDTCPGAPRLPVVAAPVRRQRVAARLRRNKAQSGSDALAPHGRDSVFNRSRAATLFLAGEPNRSRCDSVFNRSRAATRFLAGEPSRSRCDSVFNRSRAATRFLAREQTVPDAIACLTAVAQRRASLQGSQTVSEPFQMTEES